MLRNPLGPSLIAFGLLFSASACAYAAYSPERPIPSSRYLSQMLLELDARSEKGTLGELLPEGCYAQLRRERDLGIEYAPWAAKAANRDDADIASAQEGVNQAYYEDLLHLAMLSATPAKALVRSMQVVGEQCRAELSVDLKDWRAALYEMSKQFPAPRAGDPAADFSLLYTSALARTIQSLTAGTPLKPEAEQDSVKIPRKGAARYVIRNATLFREALRPVKPATGFPKKGQALSAGGWTSLRLPTSCVTTFKSFQAAGEKLVDDSYGLWGGSASSLKDSKAFVSLSVSNMATSLAAWMHASKLDKNALGELTKECTALQTAVTTGQDAAGERLRIEFNELTGWSRKRFLDVESHGEKALRLLRSQF